MITKNDENFRNVTISDISLYFLPAPMRVPLRFGSQTLTEVHCARVKITVKGLNGELCTGWGETPLSVGWVWPSEISYTTREAALKKFCIEIISDFQQNSGSGHPIEISQNYIENSLKKLTADFSENLEEEIPCLAALVCFSAFDIALHDAYARLHQVSAFETLKAPYMNKDLSAYMDSPNGHSFAGEYPSDYLIKPQTALPVWHLVGGLDALEDSELDGSEPNDNYPVTLVEWIKSDGLKCLKIKLKGNNADWDRQRLLRIGEIALENQLEWLTADFNCTVTDPNYVDSILDWFRDNHPKIYGMILYVEQPFPYDLNKHRIDVHSCSSRKPLFMDESAHDWTYVKLGYSLGWNGVALKTCKTFTGALLSLCWAKAHGMTVMVQDLTNPMLAQIPHVQLAAHAGTIMGVESNGMQFYPEVSSPERAVHPGLYKRNGGILDLSTLGKTGFGYCEDKIQRQLPAAAV